MTSACKIEKNLKEGVLRAVPGKESVCYFIGAGFSKACDSAYPAAKGFFTRQLPYIDPVTGELRTAQRNSMPRGKHGLLDNIENQYVGPGETLEDLDLEAVMTDLYVRAFGLGQSWEELMPPSDLLPVDFLEEPGGKFSVKETQRDFEDLLDYIVLRLRPLDSIKAEYPAAKRLAEALKGQDSVVTLNYDTLLERHIAGGHEGHDDRLAQLRYTLGPRGTGYGGSGTPIIARTVAEGRGVFTKLHGSLNWSTCPNEACPNHPYIDAALESTVATGGRWADRRCDSCGWGLQVVIIPPIASKVFREFPKLKVMWNHSYQALWRAHRWVFIGVSFAVTDFHLSALLRSASRDVGHTIPKGPQPPEICVVNKSYEDARQVAERLYHMLAPWTQIHLHDGSCTMSIFDSVEKYLDKVASVDAEREDA